MKLVECAGGGLECDGEGGCVDESEASRDDRVERHECQFSGGPGGGDAEHTVTDIDSSDPVPDLVDNSRDIGTCCLREGPSEVQCAGTDFRVCCADAWGVDGDSNLAWRGVRIREINDLEHFWTAEGAE